MLFQKPKQPRNFNINSYGASKELLMCTIARIPALRHSTNISLQGFQLHICSYWLHLRWYFRLRFLAGELPFNLFLYVLCRLLALKQYLFTSRNAHKRTNKRNTWMWATYTKFLLYESHTCGKTSSFCHLWSSGDTRRSKKKVRFEDAVWNSRSKEMIYDCIYNFSFSDKGGSKVRTFFVPAPMYVHSFHVLFFC